MHSFALDAGPEGLGQHVVSFGGDLNNETRAVDATSAGDGWLRTVLRPLAPLFRETFAIAFFINLLALAAPVFVLQVYDRVVYHAGLSTLQGLTIGMVFVLLFDYVLKQTRARVMQRVSLEIDVKVGRRLFNKVMALPLRTLENRPSGYWHTLFRDLDVIRNALAGASAALVADLPFAILFLGVVFLIAEPVAWVLTISLVGFLTLAWLSARGVAKAAGEEKNAQQTRDSLMAETIIGRTTIKALALDGYLRPKWEDKHADMIEKAVSRGSATDRYVSLGQTLTVATTVGMTTVGALAIIDQNMTIGALVAANMLSGRLLGPLNQLVGAWRTLAGFRQSMRRLDGLFAEEEDRTETQVSLPRPNGRLRADHVVFQYGQNREPVINDVAIEFQPGGITAIMGRNGSGKSTLLKLLLGLYRPQKGRVLLDQADIEQFTRRELASWMGYVPQDCVLFTGTVRENVAQGKADATDDQIIQAAQLAGVHQFVIDLPDGYATSVGEAGGLMSGGMRQRIAIARALVADPPILILDEPTASLDHQAEEQLRSTLVELARKRSVIVVTHSPRILQACRTIVVMEQGKVAAMGPAADVLRMLTQPPAGRGKPAQQRPQTAPVPTAPAPAPVPQGT